MQKAWKIKEPDVELKNSLASDLSVSGLFAQLLINRGISGKAEALSFLRPGLSGLHDPFAMEGMAKCVERIRLAVKRKEKVFIATDFDVDGVTSCVLLETELKRLKLEVAHYVPNRVKDGYGLNRQAVELAKRFGANVFISLDCGITSVREIKELKNLKIDCLIVDHHEPPAGELPPAFAILDPKQKTCHYPFKDLAGVGLAYKLAQALGTSDPREHLDLVALGTVADVVPLRGENRIFVKHGLDVLNATKKEGLKSLMAVAGIKKKKISTHSISFILAPRINASGRVDSANSSLDMLLSEDPKEADRLAQYINENNKERQKIEEKVLTEAMGLIERDVNFKDDLIIVLCKEDWHPGVLGIVASKIVDRFYRPAIIISLQDNVGRGSARSVRNFHIYEALAQCGSFLKEFGGHKYAAGLTIDRANIAEFKAFLNVIARAKFKNENLSPILEVDAQIPLSLIDERLFRDIDRLSPYGEGNRRPIFVSRDLVVKSKPQLVGKNSLKFWVSDGELTYEAIGFGMKDFFGMVSEARPIDLAYCLGRDDWNSANLLQLEIKDIKPS
ncbi:MAG: single-stranded-DNA-specific exonuclease RecJ [Candidatus Omnitrophica bacterium CG1_02_44_16]|nr:MAG: single-stranded-DNA-specific exonuclease RecJ [Candidatus Omnitrophica bacterium CG1_02_44_16]PIY83619.1 MAG: single-stranded-DNA-specific exonuclease RecJ [Candidatus Omnitrophica bacterium CG_4_10_14_0_8_um_filter_44_12]PIZ84766.1 MAG: single-stranded-DNA-specific exonuclease RecJ [Candidatus Omnitrophica bacterium CG_4_10_14_0_2_um_filter_44_9]